MQERERYVLYAIVLFLALVVGWLAWQLKGKGLEGKLDGIEERIADAVTGSWPVRADVSPEDVSEVIVRAIERQSAGLDSRVADAVHDKLQRSVESKLDGLEERIADAVTGSWPVQSDVSPEDVSEAIVRAIERQLAGLDSRVADAVYDKLRREGICELAAGEQDGCGEAPLAPPSVPVGKNFTFLFDNAYLDPNRHVTKDNKGVKLDRHHIARLDLIAKAFLACQRIDDPVSFHVAGYSSTAEFRVETESGSESLPNTDELNLETANLRMANVANYLESRGFRVDTERWDSIAALRRPYIDDFEPGADQQALNRTVFLQITNAGRCDLDRLAPPPT